MKQFSLLFAFLIALGGATMVQAQSHASNVRRLANKPVVPASLQKPVLKPAPRTGFEQQTVVPSVPPAQRSGLTEEVAGNTQYDLQTNGSESARLHVWPDGEVSAIWTFSSQADGSNWPDRGTGYNNRTNWLAFTLPTARLEASARAGFPNYVVTSDGVELIVNHITKLGGYQLHTLRRAPGQSNWTESNIPSNVAVGQLWCKAAVDGNTVHVIAITTLVSLAGSVYQGVDGHLLYYRSKDGGLTWDITDGIIPGIDQTAFAQLSADNYCIDARDGTVAVGVFDSWNDALVVKSTDGGDTWGTPYVLLDFPLDKYIADQGYTTSDIGGIDPNAPDSLAIFTTDGSASIVVDPFGYVHAFVGETYVLDAVLTDGTTSYFPGTNGLIYWSEITADDLFEITASFDWNNNDTLDINTLIAYGTGLSSMPAAAVDENGGIYLAYSANVENLHNFYDENYRHIYTMKSPDLGNSWTDPVDIHYLALTGGDSLLANFSEGVWPMAYKKVDDVFHLVYQRDFNPGSAVQLTGNQDGLSDIIYLAHADIVSAKTPQATALPLALTPNPAAHQTLLNFNLPQRGAALVEVIDYTGRVQYSRSLSDLPAGPQQLRLELGGLADGLYVVRLRSGLYNGVQKLLVLGGGR